MKNLVLMLFLLGFGNAVCAQWSLSGSNIYNANAGNVGIGTTTPASPLEVRSDYDDGTFVTVKNASSSTSAYAGFAGRAQNQSIQLSALSDGFLRSYPGFHSSSTYVYGSASNGLNIISDAGLGNIGANTGTIRFVTYNGAGGVTSLFSGNDALTRMIITGTGNVGIGTTAPTEKLAVNGKIRAKEIKVETNWADFVFKPDYKLRTLADTEKFIRQKGHLPEIPSAKEVAENGINVGEMNSKLLQKIEELTLYLIEQNKQIKDLQSEVSRLKSNTMKK